MGLKHCGDGCPFYPGKRHCQSKLIRSLFDMGQELTEPSQLRKSDTGFYSSLYSSKYKEREELFEEEFGCGLPQVSKTTLDQLDRLVQESQLHAALQIMQGRWAPSINGIRGKRRRRRRRSLSGDRLLLAGHSRGTESDPKDPFSDLYLTSQQGLEELNFCTRDKSHLTA